MRDTLKPREYFDAFIIQQAKIAEKYETRLNAGTIKEDRILPVKDALLQVKLGIIVAKFSRGDSVEILKKEFTSLIDLFFESWERDSYEDNLKFASLSYLFEVDEKIKNRIGEKLKERLYYDSIINFILYGGKNIVLDNTISFPESYSKLADVIATGNVDALVEYLRGWYDDHEDSSWYNAHKCKDYNIYYGYWCFEAAAVVKRMALQDESLKKEKYYPYDIVHF